MSVLIPLSEAHDPATNARGMAAVQVTCTIMLSGIAKAGKFADPAYASKLILYEEVTPGRTCRVPLAVGRQIWRNCPPPPIRRIPRPENVARQPRPGQEEIVNMMFDHLGADGGVMLNCDPGMGKTFMSWYASLALNLPTVVVVARVDFALQWANELSAIRESCASLTCVMGGKAEKNTRYTATPETAQFLIVRAGLLGELSSDVMNRYSVIILDETHMLGTQNTFTGLLRFGGAQYIIGCSGTPEKPDGRHAGIEAFLGLKSIVARDMRPIDFAFADINVCVDESYYFSLLRGSSDREGRVTGPPPHMAEYGRMEISIASSPITTNRLALVAYAAWKMGHKILIMSKYRRQCMAIVDVLRRWGVRAAPYIADSTRKGERYDGFADVLVGTTQITMTAFDQASSGVQYDRRFSAAILCQSLAQEGNLWQAIGRIMRAPADVEPLFIAIHYPQMSAYANQHTGMVRTAKERKLRIRDHTFIFPPEIYERYVAEVKKIEIIRSIPPIPPPHEVFDHPEGNPLRPSDTEVPLGNPDV